MKKSPGFSRGFLIKLAKSFRNKILPVTLL
jgi:hypothetical protein